MGRHEIIEGFSRSRRFLTNVADALAEVAFPIPLRRFFDYRVSAGVQSTLQPGHRVWAPLGRRRRQMGVVLRCHEPEAGGLPLENLKELEGVVEPAPALDERDIALAHWMADRYACSVGEALMTVCPLGRRSPPRRAFAPEPPTSLPPAPPPEGRVLTDEQTSALARLLPALQAGSHHRFLLQGVSASGKTEVYRQAISACLALGRGAILLVPEIGLTPQMEDRLRGWFGEALEIWHSARTDRERWRIWRRVKDGRARVIVGPRSALFLPVAPLGLVILDEEHDPSYKQDAAPTYHARDTAEEKARLHGAVLLLGSATPSLETTVRVPAREIERLLLSRRVENRPFPRVHLVDMRREGWYLSDPLVNALRDRLDRGEQSMLFLNRRGYATRAGCPACGWEARCPHCAVSLVVHRPKDRPVHFRCHTCDHAQPWLDRCPTCAGTLMKFSGRGTQRVMADIAMMLPKARCLRWDRDTADSAPSHGRFYRDVAEGRVDVIVGTQMIAQGHDFPNVTLVGVLDADRSLSFPDFRATERTFQLLMQVAGRAGRADRPGEVVVQTRHPDHPALRALLERDFDAFARQELADRKEAGYPPFTRLLHMEVRARADAVAESTADELLRWMEEGSLPKETELLGPAPAFHRQKAGWSHWLVVVKTLRDQTQPALARAECFPLPPGVGLRIDVDPEGMA